MKYKTGMRNSIVVSCTGEHYGHRSYDSQKTYNQQAVYKGYNTHDFKILRCKNQHQNSNSSLIFFDFIQIPQDFVKVRRGFYSLILSVRKH